MKTGIDNRKQTIMAAVAGVIALGACIFIYEELFGTGTPPPPPPTAAVTAPVTVPAEGPAVAAPEAKKVGTTSAALDPTLHMEAMLASEAVEYSGSGRNIFSQNSAPPVVVIPPPVAPARPKTVVAAYVPPPLPQGPPPPPPIDLKFFGVETQANGKLVALLLHGDSVLTASSGDVVARRYRIIAVEAKTIQVEDMQNNNRQTLPLLVN
jgi:hypothetical protein